MIKATFKNIGPIKEAELELGDLTIIAGQNNTGKSYLAHALYSFLRFLICEKGYIYSSLGCSREINEKIKKIVRQLEKTGEASIEAKEYNEMHKWLIEDISKFFSKEKIHQAFSSPRSEFENAEIHLEIEPDNQVTKKTFHYSGKSNIDFLFDNENLKIKLNNPKYASSSEIEHDVSVLFRMEVSDNWPFLHILSAERFGISLFHKELDFSKRRTVEKFQNSLDDKRPDRYESLVRERTARYAQPIKDNIDFTGDLDRICKQEGRLADDGYRSIIKMMDGYYKVVKDEVRFISTKEGKNRFDIPPHLASSSAQGLSDLYFYLKHCAEPGQILIIDEPESHLSPRNQVLMARLLVFCVNAGLKVLITTHSDYIIKEINNLIMLHSDFDKKEKFLMKHNKDYTEDDHLDPDFVKAYICEDGTLKARPIDKRGIDGMTVFDDAIDSINLISEELDMYVDDSEDD